MASRKARKRASQHLTAARTKRNATIAAALVLVLAAIAIAILAFQSEAVRSVFRDPDIAAPPRFVGSETCGSCHVAEIEAWRTSHHAKAMAHATDKSVLGDFNDATFDYFGIRSRMFKRGERFMVETDGPDGKPATFEIKYTFGIEPLQQYLVELPGGRVQALALSWDSHPKDQGGQRWFHLYPNEKVEHTDDLHWTKLNQNWNFMCAECHSTGVRKNYREREDAYRTTYAEISVGCEGCHAEGSRHVALARSQRSLFPFARNEDATLGLLVRYAERVNVTWPINDATGSARRSAQPPVLRTETEACGMCHARRGQLSESWIPGRWLSQTHVVSPLARGLYDASGQMDDEVFNYGSFKQSKMFAAGVTCSDCHDPHSGKLRLTGDNACLQCHAAERFSAASHHRHENVSPPVTCANCHMPVRTYMVVDRRHDHSFRIPRPDLSVQTGVRNACTDCHAEKSASWAAGAVQEWHGSHRKGFQTYTTAFAASRAYLPEAGRLLTEVANDRATPAIARATALSDLAAHHSPDVLAAARNASNDSDPMVRIAALDSLDAAPPQQSFPIAARLLTDPVRGVRIRAALLLAGLPPAMWSAKHRRAFDAAAEEFVAAQKLNADRPESRTDLGAFYAKQGRLADAEVEYRSALRLNGKFAPAYVNLSDLYRHMNREDEAISTLREGIRMSPADAALSHALGLALVRAKSQPDEALMLLRTAAELAPENARYGYVHGVALYSFGHEEDALKTLRDVATRFPNDRDTLVALVNYEQKRGDITAALGHAEKLRRARPTDPALLQLIEALKKLIK